ncbi:MAG: hypothetical protein II938_03210 [Alphaproteobacteria bacterium]|nr:hypothetical protein [Alphaproteobacteria bacterium]
MTENTQMQNEEMAVAEVKFLFAREEARKHGHEFSNAEDEKTATERFDCLSPEDKRYWLDHVFEIERKMVKFGTRDLRIFYPNNARKTISPVSKAQQMTRNFRRRGSRG